MAREVTLVDAGLGNIASVERALIQVGAAVRVTGDPDQVARSRMVVFPGQSAFGATTQAIVEGAMGAALRMVIERGDPFLGICLGMQLLFDGSEENGGQEGLHVLPGTCRRFPDGMVEEAEPGAEESDAPPAEPKAETDRAQSELRSGDPAPRPAYGARPEHFGETEAANEPAGIRSPDSAAGWSTSGATSEVASPAPVGSSSQSMSQMSTSGSFEVANEPVGEPPPPLVAASSGGAAPATAATVPETPVPPPEARPAPEPPKPLVRHLKVPHMGWNEVEPTGDHYYFVHSYYVEAERTEDVMWVSTYGGIRFPAAVRRGNVMGCQFHPEKSQRAGLKFLRAFILGGWG